MSEVTILMPVEAVNSILSQIFGPDGGYLYLSN